MRNTIKNEEVLLIFVIIIGLVFMGWPKVLVFAEETTSTPEAPILNSQDATLTSEVTTSTFESATSTPVIENQPPPVEEQSEEQPAEEQPVEEGAVETEEDASEEETSILLPVAPSLPALPKPPLKFRQLQKMVQLDKNARHSCEARSFAIDLSGRSQVILELELKGERGDAENIEIGSLPLGIDITFLNNASYSYQPQKNDNTAVVQIINRPDSQKGNFSVPVIYASGNSTTICQINIINF